MTPDELRAITFPAVRERAAREAVEVYRTLMGECATIRREAVQAMYREHGSWRVVGEVMGVSTQKAHEVAHPRKRKADQ